MDANDFARYVMTCGMVDIMEKTPSSPELRKYFPYNGKQLYSEANKLRIECCQYFEGQTRDSEGTPSGPDKSDLEEIDQKLTLLLIKKRKRQLRTITGIVTPIHLIAK